MSWDWTDPGSWVSSAGDLWNSLTGSGGDTAGAVGDTAGAVGDTAGAVAANTPTAVTGAGTNYLGDSLANGLSAANSFNSYQTPGLSLSDVSVPVSSQTEQGLMSSALSGAAPSAADPGAFAGMDVGSAGGVSAAPTSEPGLLSSAVDWTKKNPTQLSNLLQFGAGLAKNYSPTQASQTQANLTAAGNTSAQDIAGQKTAVGQSLINTAPGLATNSLAASMGANASAQQHLQQTLTAQGYHPGDPQYDSQMAQFGTNSNANNMTAYGQGALNADQQMSAGAGLLTAYTPSTAGLNNLNTQQTGQQVGSNTQLSDATNLAGAALNIYNNPTDPNAVPAPAATKTKPPTYS